MTGSTDEPDPFDDVSLALLRTRQSAKWATYPPDVLPAWVAETDFALAAPIREVLQAAIARDDTGYGHPGRIGDAFAGFASARFDWDVDPGRVRVVADVMSGVAEILRVVTEPGDGVVINPPIYPPFRSVTRDVGRTVVEVPLTLGDGRPRLDLDGLDHAFAAGARAYLLCNPHNPTGRSLTREELTAVASLAARYDVTVISDEVHAPMTLAGSTHVPFLTLGAEAVEHGVVITSSSKAFNLPGLKCALLVSAPGSLDTTLKAGLPAHLSYHAGHHGMLASVAAFERGGEWLDALNHHLDRNRHLLTELLESALPEVRYLPPDAGYLAWLDCRTLGLGDDPARAFLEHGRVALTSGPTFGAEGRGYARLNMGTSSALLEEAVKRMASAVPGNAVSS